MPFVDFGKSAHIWFLFRWRRKEAMRDSANSLVRWCHCHYLWYHTNTIAISYRIIPWKSQLHTIQCHYHCHFMPYHTITIAFQYIISLPVPSPLHTVSCHYHCNPFLEWHLLPGSFALMVYERNLITRSRWYLHHMWNIHKCFYRTRVRSLAMLVTNWLTP